MKHVTKALSLNHIFTKRNMGSISTLEIEEMKICEALIYKARKTHSCLTQIENMLLEYYKIKKWIIGNFYKDSTLK